MKLPITLILNSDPPKFRWEQTVDTPIGPSTVENEGVVPIPLEGALIALIEMCERQSKTLVESYKEIERLKKELAVRNAHITSIKSAETKLIEPRLAPIQPTSPKKGK